MLGCLPGLLAAEEKIPSPRSKDIKWRMLEANRSLLSGFEAEYAALKQEESEKPGPQTQRRLLAVKVKIDALKDDAGRLESSVAPNIQASVFLEDLIRKKTILAARPPKKPGAAAPPSQSATLMGLHEKALGFVASKKLEEASKIYEEITLIDPDDEQAYIIMGHTYLLRHRYEAAERAFHNAVSINPENIGEITPFYENLIIQNPDDDEAYSNLGYACVIVGDMEKAVNAFKNALDINPENQESLKGLAVLTGELPVQYETAPR